MSPQPLPHVPDSLIERMMVEWNRTLVGTGSDIYRMTETQRARYFGARSMLAVLAGTLGITGPDWLVQLGLAARELAMSDCPHCRAHAVVPCDQPGHSHLVCTSCQASIPGTVRRPELPTDYPPETTFAGLAGQ